MEAKTNHIYPVFDVQQKRKEKEKFLQQHSKVLWITGLSGSGKSTIALGLEYELTRLGYLSQVLDGDNIRSGINNNLGFTEKDRLENIRRIGEVGKLLMNCGIITISCFISPTRAMRQQAKDIIGAENFVEIFISTPIEICEQRDIKGLYKKARKGEIKNFTGIDAPYEPPLNPDVKVDASRYCIEESVKMVLDYIIPMIEYKQQ
ncbi:MAG: adenylyl-sulfate kinase [Bacteroidota bacterium]